MRVSLLAIDGTMPFLGIYRTSRGKVVYVVEYMKDGKTVGKVLGKVSKLSRKKAHKAARKWLKKHHSTWRNPSPIGNPAAARPTSDAPPKPAPTSEPPAETAPVSTRRIRRTKRMIKPVEQSSVTSSAGPAQDVARTIEIRPSKLLVFDELKTEFGIPYTRSYIRKLEAQGKFPKRVLIGDRRVAWVASEIDAYLKNRIATRFKVQNLRRFGQRRESGNQ
jgi:prophage regulatory protein